MVRFLNDPSTLRLPGGARVPGGTVVEGNVAVLGGGIQLAGRIRGDLLVVNGDLRMEPGAHVEGIARIVGGRLLSGEASWAEDGVEIYQASLRYRLRDDRVEVEDYPGVALPRILSGTWGPARVRLTLRAAGTYNRVEGLPVSLGPVVEAGSRNPFHLEAFGIWRSVDGLDLERRNLGYVVRGEQALGGSGELFLSLSAHSVVRPVETRGLSDAESSLATFLLRRDFLDHLEATGWSASLALRPVDRPLEIRMEYREEDHEAPRLRDPWTLRDRERAWRPLALMGEGPLRTLSVHSTLDTRDDIRDPSSGWWIQGRLRRAVGGDLRTPALDGVGGATGLASSEVLPLALDGTLDLRRYNRLGPDSRLNLRLLATGSLDGNPLPPQHQVALGGEGSLPGHPAFAVDCGARSGSYLRDGEEIFPFYGCDRALLGQVEYHGFLPFSWSPGSGDGDWEWDALLELRPAWTLFLNAGRGWAVQEERRLAPAEDDPLRTDVGLGLHVGPVGLYWAYPLNQRDRGLNFFVRLQHRF